MELYVDNKPFMKVLSVDSCVTNIESEHKRLQRKLQSEARIVLEDVKISDLLITYFKMFDKYFCNNWRKMHHLPLLRKRVLKRKKIKG